MITHGKHVRKNSSPLILVGAPGSGASQLFKKLATAENVHVLDESGRDRLMAILPRRKDSDCLTEADATPAVVAALSKLAQAPVGENGTRVESRFLLSLKSAALQIPFWAAVFPDAKFIFVQRDANQQIDRMITAWNSGRAVTRPRLAGWEGPQWSLPLIPGFQALAGKSIQEIAAAQWATITAQALHDLGHLAESRWCALGYDQVLNANLDAAKWGTLFAGLTFRTLPVASNEYQILRHAQQVAEVAPLVSEIAQAAARLADTCNGNLELESVVRRNPFAPRKPSLVPAQVAKAVSVGRLAASLFIGTALMPSAAQADVFEVTNTNASGSGSLLEAIWAANDNYGHDTITFSPNLSGIIDLNTYDYYGPGPRVARGGYDYNFEIYDSVTIEGPGADILAIGGSSDERIFDIVYGDVVIAGLTLQNSYDYSTGSVIRVEDSNLLLRDARIVDNYSSYGAVAIEDGELLVQNVAFIGNSAYGGGSAIYADDAYVAIDNSIFAENESYNAGGAIRGNRSYLIVNDSQLVDNSTYGYSGSGGALGAQYSTVGIINSIVSGNSANGYGGAVGAYDVYIGFQNTVFADNQSYRAGGAVAVGYASLMIDRSSFANNAADYAGGAIFTQGVDLWMRDSTISGNDAENGGGLLAANSDAYLDHLTIVNNRGYYGGGILGDSSEIYLENSIVANNLGDDLTGDNFYIEYSLVKDNSGGADGNASNLVNVDPKLSELARGGRTAFVHKPLAGSPVINAGDETFAANDGETDNRGLPRVIDGRTDMGAVEFSDGTRGPVDDSGVFPPAKNPFANVVPISLGTVAADSTSGCNAGGSAGGLLPLGFMAAAAALRRRRK